MTIRYLLLVGICLGIARCVYGKDSTLVPGESSDDVIDATIRKIRTKCILAQDYYFLRRLAMAQMKSIASTTGGIWRITSAQLSTVQSACNGNLKIKCSTVKTEFNVDVSTLTMPDLQIPLYSGLVMSLLISNSISSVPLSKGDQANSWKNNIHSSGNTTQFSIWSDELEKLSKCAGAQMDLVFLIDSSGSVGKSNFLKTKAFLNNVVNNLDISTTETRVAVVRFSSSPLIAFNLGTFNTKPAVTNAINGISYNGGGTNTAAALDTARISVFPNTRPSGSGSAAKVLVLVTDGYSNSEILTVAAAKKLKDDGVIIFTIGIINPRVSELTAAASEPSCTHFIRLQNYGQIQHIVREIQSESCKAYVSVTNGTDLTGNGIPCNGTKEQVLDITDVTQSNSGTTITVSVQYGVVIVYGAYNNTQPSSANYDYTTNATDMKPGKLFVVRQTSSSTFFLTIISQKRFDLNSSACNNASYNITIDATDPSITVTCRQNNTQISCSTEDLEIILHEDFNYPCTKENREKGLYLFPHPNQPDKYFLCDCSGNLTIVLCPENQTFDATLRTCKPSVPTLPGISLKTNPCVVNPPAYYYPHPTSLSKFIQCDQWGGRFEMPCPPTLYWDPNTLVCNYNPVSIVCGANSQGMLQSHPLSNRYFIACVTDTDYEIRKCEANKIWKQNLNKCS